MVEQFLYHYMRQTDVQDTEDNEENDDLDQVEIDSNGQQQIELIYHQ